MRDNSIYTEEMSKSNWDKAFFMDKISTAKCVIDFGCADGAMIRALAPLFPSIEFFGYDIDNNMIDRAKTWTKDSYFPCAFWYGNQLREMVKFIKDHYNGDQICLNFSSVLHEVFSFKDFDAIHYIIKELNPKYITIRDMYYHEDPDAAPLYFTFVVDLLQEMKVDKKYITEFEDKFGPILTPKQYLHFLMKYQWIENGWEEELKENYFSWDIANFRTAFGYQYYVIYENHYTLPYLTEKWHPYFFRPDWQTHAQFILVRF